MTLRIHSSAYKHGIDADDFLHAVRYAVRSWRQQRNSNTVAYIGADRNGRLLEIVVLEPDDGGESIVIHADVLRSRTFVPTRKVKRMSMADADVERIADEAVRELHETDPDALLGYQADAADLRSVAELTEAIERAQRELTTAVLAARLKGRSWGQIATFLGVSRQSAWERFGTWEADDHPQDAARSGSPQSDDRPASSADASDEEAPTRQRDQRPVGIPRRART